MNVLEEGRSRRYALGSWLGCIGVLMFCACVWLAVIAATAWVWRHA